MAWALGGSVLAAPISGQGTWETSLKARDLGGNPLASLSDPSAVFYYDTALDITWLRNWNAGAGSSFDSGVNTTDGRMTWNDAVAWASALTVGSFDNWRLPTVVDTGTPGCNFGYSGTDCGYYVDTAGSELAHMYYVTLGNKGFYDTTGNAPQPGWGLTNTAQFSAMQADVYWTGTELEAAPTAAWLFATIYGSQSGASKIEELYAVAVRPGDVAAIPEPMSVVLLLAGLAAMTAVGLRRPR